MAMDEQTVLARLFSLTESIGKTESSLALTSKSLDNISKKLDDVVINQEKLLHLQVSQGEAIKEIDEKDTVHYVDNKNRTKELFKKTDELEDKISKLEGQMKAIQEQQQISSDEKKETIKGKWAFFAATITAVLTAITAVVLALIK